MSGNPRISIYMITYNQENVIDRTLSSILEQKDYVYEVCISDDHSTDRTWDKLQEYNMKYPGLFKLCRNDSNLGIFANTENVWKMPTGDIVYDLAGDDSVSSDWFKTVITFIKDNNIDYKNELFCIYGDYKCIYPNGDSIIFRQSSIAKQPHNSLRMALRGIIGGRGCCYSKRILEKFERVSDGRSHKVEHAQDRQLQIYASSNYYIPKIANIYYTNIGVSTQIKNEDIYRERLEIWPYTINYLKSKNIIIPKVDINYGNFDIAITKFLFKPSVCTFLKVFYFYVISRDFTLPCGNGIKHILFALIRRFPHNSMIHL